MSDEKTFTVVGTSIKKGEKTLRFANGTAEAREKVLLKDNHSEVRLFDLPKPMPKEDAVKWLEAQGDAIPVRVPTVKVAKTPATPKVVRVGKAVRGEVNPAVATSSAEENTDYDDAAKALHAAHLLRFLTWEQLDRECRDEFRAKASRAAQAAVENTVVTA